MILNNLSSILKSSIIKLKIFLMDLIICICYIVKSFVILSLFNMQFSSKE